MAQETVVGYPRLAAKIEVLPETAIFRRFGALNAQNLLYYQAELTYLEQKLKKQQEKDRNLGSEPEKWFAVDWYWLERSRQQSVDTTQLDLVLKIRTRLKEYNELLIQQSTILHYEEPGKWDLHHLQDFLELPEHGALALDGLDATIWGSSEDRKSHQPDLVTLRPRAQEDSVSKWAAEHAASGLLKYTEGFARFQKPSRRHGVIAIQDGTVYKITYWVTVILAALIPIVSIAVLNEVQDTKARLGIIAAFNILISVCLIGFADAKRDQVFAINAAFAAVQVVFIGQEKCPMTLV